MFAKNTNLTLTLWIKILKTHFYTSFKNKNESHPKKENKNKLNQNLIKKSIGNKKNGKDPQITLNYF